MKSVHGLLFVAGLLTATLAAAQATTQPDAPPASQPDSQPASQPSSRPTTQPESQPTTQPESQPASRPDSQPTSKPTSSRATSTTSTSTTSTTSTQAAEKKKDRYLAVINAEVHTLTGPVLERATVLSKNGVITALGASVQLPPECEIIDGAGLRAYPGLIAAASAGLMPGDNPQDTADVHSLTMLIGLAGGITTTVSGTNADKLCFGTLEGLVLKRDLFQRLNYNTRAPLERAQLRADLERVRNYLREVQKFEREKATNKDAKAPDKEWLKDKYEQYRRLLLRETVAVAAANNTQSLRDVAGLAETYGFDLVVTGAYEGWTAARELNRANVGAIISPRTDGGFGNAIEPDPRLNRPNGPTIENARLLREHGVRIAIVPVAPAITLSGLAGRDLLHLNMEAAFAVRGGLSDEDALRAITIDAARLFRLDDRIGSLEVGKDADLVLCDGDILHYMTQVRYTIVNGRVAYNKAKETLYAHIRPTGKPEVTPFDDQWPRRLEWRD
jgi:hypothetical protein